MAHSREVKGIIRVEYRVDESSEWVQITELFEESPMILIELSENLDVIVEEAIFVLAFLYAFTFSN